MIFYKDWKKHVVGTVIELCINLLNRIKIKKTIINKNSMQSIELFNPNDKPFGKLSNNAYHPMTINGKKYNTVTNYIYSNMLLTPLLRTVVQNAKIRGTSTINQELMGAIDYLLKTGVTGPISQKEEPMSLNQMGQLIIQNSNYTTKDIYGDSNKPEHLRTSWSRQRIKQVYEDIRERLENQPGGSDIQQAWIDYAKTGRDKEQEKVMEKRKNLQILIADEVRKPFESINLVQLKKIGRAHV